MIYISIVQKFSLKYCLRCIRARQTRTKTKSEILSTNNRILIHENKYLHEHFSKNLFIYLFIQRRRICMSLKGVLVLCLQYRFYKTELFAPSMFPSS
jgi:hypothetical protein